MIIVQCQMPLHAIVRSWTLLAALPAAHELLAYLIENFDFKVVISLLFKNIFYGIAIYIGRITHQDLQLRVAVQLPLAGRSTVLF